MGNTISQSSTEAAFEWLNNVYEEFRVEFEDKLELSARIDGIAASNEVSLTPGARLLLTIPLLELMEVEKVTENKVECADVSVIISSLERLVGGMKSGIALADIQFNETEAGSAEGGKRRSTMTTIKRYFSEFCHIPPFCSNKDNEGKPGES